LKKLFGSFFQERTACLTAQKRPDRRNDRLIHKGRRVTRIGNNQAFGARLLHALESCIRKQVAIGAVEC
jgi:hypothetical protein